MSPILSSKASMSAQAYGLLGVTAVPYSPTGAYDALATVTVPSGGLSSITFSGIPSTYTHLQIRASWQLAVHDNTLAMRFNGDTGNNYSYHWLYGIGAGSGSAYRVANASRIEMGYNWSSVTAGTYSSFSGSIIDILDYTSATKNKTIRHLGGVDYNPGGQIHLNSGLWYATPTPITSISLNANTYTDAFQQYSTFSLYGVK